MNIVINSNMAYISIQAAHKFISSARHKFRTPFKYVLWTRRGWPRILSPHCEKVCAPRASAVITENFLPLPGQNDKIVSRGIKFARGVWRWHYKRTFALPCKHAVSRCTLFFYMRYAYSFRDFIQDSFFFLRSKDVTERKSPSWWSICNRPTWKPVHLHNRRECSCFAHKMVAA